MDPIPLTLLTGFLGSGKTTLLSRALTGKAIADLAVVINEFGEIALDHELVESSEETVLEISGGCLCCTIRDDLRSTLADLARRRDDGSVARFRQVIVESTGLADPGPIIRTLLLDPVLARRFRLAGIVTAVDAVNGDTTLDRFAEAVEQVCVADRIVLTKADLADDPASREDLRSLVARLRRLNPVARIVEACPTPADAAALLSAAPSDRSGRTEIMEDWIVGQAADGPEAGAWAEEAAGHHAHGHDGHGHEHLAHDHEHDVNRHGDDIRAHCIAYDEPIDAASFRLGLELLKHCCGEDLLRVKAILNVRGQSETPIVVQGAQHVLSDPVRLPAWPSADRRSRVVLILRGVPGVLVEQLLSAFRVPSAPDTVAGLGDDAGEA